jgi:hypothetical protein
MIRALNLESVTWKKTAILLSVFFKKPNQEFPSLPKRRVVDERGRGELAPGISPLKIDFKNTKTCACA